MADIPEYPSTVGGGVANHDHGGVERLDPRSGMVSPRAWRTATDESNIHPPQIQSTDALNDVTNITMPPSMPRPVGRSQTEDFEMSRLH